MINKRLSRIGAIFMKTSHLACIGLGILLNYSFAIAAPLDNWHWRNPLPNGNSPSGPHQMNAIVFANGKFVAVGVSGTVSVSTDVTNWTESATATTNDLNGMVYANGQFVAVGNNGVVETSADGTNWILQMSGTTNSLLAVAFGNEKFVAVATNAVIASANAATWTPAISGLSGAGTVAGGDHGFVALKVYVYGGSLPSQVYFSADGLTWTTQTLTAPGSVFGSSVLQTAIATFWNGTFYVGSYRYATSASADMFIFSSTDGSNWSTNKIGNDYTGAGGFSYFFFMSGSNNLVAAGQANFTPLLQFSMNGSSWTETDNIPTTYAPNGLGPLAGVYENGNYVIVAKTALLNPLPPIYTSTDGLTWTNRQHAPSPPAGPTFAFTGIATNSSVYVAGSGNLVAISTNGLSYAVASNTPTLVSLTTFSNKFVGVGSNGTIYVSADGLSWTQRNSGTANNLRGITGGNGLLVAVGDNGAIETSPTSTIWTSRTSGTSLLLYGIVYANGIFVAVGQRGTVLTSTDGVNWSGQDSGQLTNLLSITYGAAGFLAAGPHGTVLVSSDGTNWMQETSGTTETLENVSFGNGYYLAVGDNAMALTSPDGVNWTSRNLGATGGQNFYGSAFLNNRFDVVGASGTVLESDTIAPLFDLQLHHGGGQNGFTMFATPGSNFRLQACTNLSAPAWGDIATFNNAAAISVWTNSGSGNNLRFFRLISP